MPPAKQPSRILSKPPSPRSSCAHTPLSSQNLSPSYAWCTAAPTSPPIHWTPYHPWYKTNLLHTLQAERQNSLPRQPPTLGCASSKTRPLPNSSDQAVRHGPSHFPPTPSSHSAIASQSLRPSTCPHYSVPLSAGT